MDARSDVFSLGAVLYEMFCGERAFKGKTAVDTMSAILKEDPAEFPEALHATAPAIERIVRRCLEKNVDERFQSARDVTFAFEALSTASGIKPVVAPDATLPRCSRNPVATAMGITLAVALVAAAAASITGRFGAPAPQPPQVTQLTFRSGRVHGARFAPDGQNVIYAASWEGQPLKLFSTRPGSSDSTTLALPDGDLMAVSRTTNEMLTTLGAAPAFTFYTRGKLARASVSGGAPRAIAENVIAADFSPDGQMLAAIVGTDGGFSLQFPLGTERLNTRYAMSHVRVAPDGEQLAFLSHPFGGDEGDVMVLGKTGAPRPVSRGWLTLQGLAWAKGGKELWFTGTRQGGVRALWSVTLDARERELYHWTEGLTLQDVAADGRALLSAGSPRSRVHFGSPATKHSTGTFRGSIQQHPDAVGDGQAAGIHGKRRRRGQDLRALRQANERRGGGAARGRQRGGFRRTAPRCSPPISRTDIRSDWCRPARVTPGNCNSRHSTGSGTGAGSPTAAMCC